MNKFSRLAILCLSTFIFTPNYAADGKAVYEKSCKICHDTGVSGAPKIGDKNAWEERLTKGMEALELNAIKGVKGKTGFMPPKGGFVKLTDQDVKAAVAYMLDTVK